LREERTMTYRVRGTAHGTEFDERGFPTAPEAAEYASLILDGDVDGTIEIEPEDVPSFDEVEAAGLDGTLRTKATPGPWTRREVDLAREANRRLDSTTRLGRAIVDATRNERAEDEFLRRPDGSIYGRRAR
ncbi:MAG TPA: hypothetical protein VFT76_02080, partial [Actinomycetota bacterium]|nr:hypothetical protein [Actinomycetota bacterium]